MARSSRIRRWFAVLIIILLIAGYYQWRARLDRPGTVAIPPALPMPHPNAYDYDMLALQQMKYACYPESGNPNALGLAWSGGKERKYSLAQRDKVLAATHDGLDTLRQGFAYSFQAPSVPFDGAGAWLAAMDNGWKAAYNDEYELVRYLRFAADTKMQHGDWDGALTCDLDALHLGSDIPQHDGIMALMRACAMQECGRDGIWQILVHLNVAQALAATLRMQQIIKRQVSLPDAIQQTQWQVQSAMLAIFRQANWRQEMQKSYGTSWRHEWEMLKTNEGKHHYISYRTIRQQEILDGYGAYMARAIAEARKPYTERKPIPEISRTLKMFSPCYISSSVPAFYNANNVVALNDTENALLLTALARQAYKAEHGNYPTVLAALEPTYLRKLPDDPFARAGSLRYVASTGKYLLYSIGPDGKDDGGRPISIGVSSTTSYQAFYADRPGDGDIVAGVNVD